MVVASLDLIGGLGEETEGDLPPLGVAPLGADDEGDDPVAIGVDGLDGEEQAITSCAL